MSILNKIIADKRREVDELKQLIPLKELEQTTFFEKPSLSMRSYLKDGSRTGIIAEFKRKSPSKGYINQFAKIKDIVTKYEKFGASGISVLTDLKYFGGINNDLTEARKSCNIPVLRKDFIIDEYQIFEAKSIGADCILLIASVLEKNTINYFTKIAHSLKLEILFEIHDKDEIKKINPDIDIIGINNRNLNSFEVNIDNSVQISKYLPRDCIKISESGLNNPEHLILLRNEGFDGFLIGENFMRTSDPGMEFKAFVEIYNSIK
jgi:indole-3-glycerol phosphate synthase